MRIRFVLFTSFCAFALFGTQQAAAQGGLAVEGAPHSMIVEELELLPGPSDIQDRAEHDALRARVSPPAAAPRASAPTPAGSDFITFGYLQSNSIKEGIRWQALTHVGSLFVSFASDGTINAANENVFLNRAVELMPGGAAEAAGTKVHIVFLNSGFNNAVTEAAMDNGDGSRDTLIAEIVALVQQDAISNPPGYVHGVSFDFEPFSWSAAAANDIEEFFKDLRTALNVVDPTLEISWYGAASPTPTQWSNLGDYIDNIDYILFSMYDYGVGTSTPRAVSDFNSGLIQQAEFLEDYGCPPEKFVPVASSYSRRFPGTTAYGVSGSGSSTTGDSYGEGLFDTELRTPTPYTRNYERGDETSWFTDGADVVVNPLGEGMEYTIRQALSFQDTGSPFAGRRLGGVGFWSLLWLADSQSTEPIDGGTVTQTRTYTETYDILQIALGTKGKSTVIVEGFEGFNPRWEDPNHSSDDVGDTDDDSFRVWETAPGGAGAPPSTTNAVRIAMNFELATGNVMFFRHELLADNNFAAVIDTNATAGFMDSSSELSAYVHSGTSGAPVALPNTRVALALMDADGELERSAFTTLSSAGWHQLTWDITDNTNIFGVTTAEPALSSGDGTLESAGGGARDIAFMGFIIEDDDGLAGSKSIFVDEVTYSHRNPGGNEYTINEFRYNDIDGEFVEIYGPAGSMPTGLQVRFISGVDATNTTVTVGGQIIPDDGGGFGYFVLGDPGVLNVDSSTGFSALVDDISNLNPSGLQLYDSTTGAVFDSVVYEAFGGLGDLIRAQTLGVADEGYPWLGRISGGTGPEGAYTKGRYPDGDDTDINYDDFSAMAATPGASNGDLLGGTLSADFSTVPSGAFQTFQAFSVQASAVGASPSGGNVHRAVDTTGGGVISFIGDAALGAGGTGYGVTGEVYIPSGAEPAQAVAVGFCGTQGGTFFTGTTAGNGYENGYWLVYENQAGIGLNDGRPDHAGTFEFVHATHDNQDGEIAALLGSITAAGASITPGTWTTFELSVDPSGASGHFLIAKINDVTVYDGAIPTGGPNSGAFQVGFRENHAEAPAATEGTWVDNIQIGTPVPIEISAFDLN